jgi:sialate O-acetylesterase
MKTCYMFIQKICLQITLLICFFIPCSAEVSPNSLFSDHMVLQRNVTVPVWGTANDGEKVTVIFQGQKVTVTAKNGKWMARLKPLKAGGPFTMSITGTNTVLIQDILVGEVWLCSGQSNMARQLGPRPSQKLLTGWEKERDAANYPQIREYYVPLKYSAAPLEDRDSKWVVCSPETVKDFSAVGYFFARDLYNNLKIPVGILFSAYGGTPAEHWTSRAALENNPELNFMVKAYDQAMLDYPAKLEAFTKNQMAMLDMFRTDSAKAAEEKRLLPRKPSAPANPSVGRMISGLFNGMISPLVPYSIKGVCWYQGESNNNNPKIYQPILSALIADWRTNWKVPDLPFLIVQIAPFKDMTPEIRESQLLVHKKTKNTALIVTTDCGDAEDIHPAFKQPVGERLALAARALAYGQSIEYSGPLYQSMKVEGNKVVLSFSHTGKGLMAKEGELTGFTIAGADGDLVPATATVSGDKIIVSSDSVRKPVAVRYGWANVPEGNLYNVEGLPASPFRTDVPK